MPCLVVLRRARVVLGLLVLAALAVPAAAAPATAAPQRFARERVLVQFERSAAASQRAAAIAGVHARRIDRLGRIGVDVLRVPRGAEEAAVRALGRRPDVVFAERDGVLEAAETMPNDFGWPRQWGQQVTNTPAAWDTTTGSEGTAIAILDTGVDLQHPDLRDSALPGYDFVNGDDDPSDDNGHGTGAAAVAAGRSDNAVGNAGYCGGCRVLPVKVADATAYALWSTMAKGTTWAADRGARVINQSYAGTAGSSTLLDAIRYARGRGAVVVASAGNQGTSTPSYPAAYPEVVSVAATTSSDALTTYSNFGLGVDVAAPGCNASAQLTSKSTTGAVYGDFCGTSSAAPAVAGILGLAAAYRPASTVAELERALADGAVPMAAIGGGRVDAAATLRLLGAGAEAAGAPALRVAPAVVDRYGGPVATPPEPGATLGASGGGWTGQAGIALAYRWQRCSATSTCADIPGATARTYVVDPADAGASLRVVVSAANASGSTEAASEVQPVGGTAAAAPTATSPPVVTGTPREGEVLTASPGAWSGDPASLAYAWQRCDASGGSCTAIAGASDAQYTAAAADVGATLRATVTANGPGGDGTASSAPTGVVAAKPRTSVFSGTLIAKSPSATHLLGVGSGPATGTLTFGKGDLTLALYAPDGRLVAKATGRSGVRVSATVTAGTYRWVVSGPVKGSVSYSLTVEHAAA